MGSQISLAGYFKSVDPKLTLNEHFWGSLTGTPTEWITSSKWQKSRILLRKKKPSCKTPTTWQLMDLLSRLKLLNALTALTPPAVFPVRSFTAKGLCVHEPVQGLNLKCRWHSVYSFENILIFCKHDWIIFEYFVDTTE